MIEDWGLLTDYDGNICCWKGPGKARSCGTPLEMTWQERDNLSLKTIREALKRHVVEVHPEVEIGE